MNGRSLGLAGTIVVHGAALVLLMGASTSRKALPPTYTVHLVAAPAPDQETRKAPESFERPAEERPAPVPAAKPPPRSSTVSRAAPPPTRDTTRREAAPRTTSANQPLPGERPSTGNDVATVSTEGVAFPFPEYLQNLVTQVLQRWHPDRSRALEAEAVFLVHRDGTVSGLQLLTRSGDYGFDLESLGAIEQAGSVRAFGALPPAWTSEVLFVRFYFTGKRQ